MLDKDMYFKILQQCIINSITKSLESRGISTEAIKDRGNTILNEGVIISGGTIRSNNFSVGKNAKAIVESFTTAQTSTASN